MKTKEQIERKFEFFKSSIEQNSKIIKESACASEVVKAVQTNYTFYHILQVLEWVLE